MENTKHPQNKPTLPPFVLLPEIAEAKKAGKPIVALESTVITHGLPWPQNANLAAEMEQKVRAHGAIPATVALIAGQVHVGLTAEEVALLAQSKQVRKVSTRDFGAALAKRELGGTTVAATMFAAEQQGIRVFATGGIGGVHREAPFDVSNDLVQLGRSPVIVVCAGAKSILDIPATIEYLETQGVPVVGWKTKQFPAFFSEDSGLPVEITAESAEEVAQIARAHWLVGLRGGILVVVPPLAEHAVPYKKMEKIIQKALQNARSEGIKGNKVTPYLLAKVSELSGGESLEANLALLLNNAGVAAQIACALGSYN